MVQCRIYSSTSTERWRVLHLDVSNCSADTITLSTATHVKCKTIEKGRDKGKRESAKRKGGYRLY